MKISATFKNGKTITRNTKMPLAFAYFSQNKYQSFTGFSATKEGAIKSATSVPKGVPSVEYFEIVEVTTI